MRSPLIGSHSVFCIWLSSEKDSWAKHRVDDLLSETWERNAESFMLTRMDSWRWGRLFLLLYILYKHIWFTSWSSGNLQVGMLMRLFFLRDNNSLEQKKKKIGHHAVLISPFSIYFIWRVRALLFLELILYLNRPLSLRSTRPWTSWL